MYNEVQKNEFIIYAGNDYWKYVFAATEPYEQELGKDICLMDTSEILHYLVGLNSFSNARTMRSRISRYIDWCVIKEYTSMNWIAPSVVSNDFLLDIYSKAAEEFYVSRELYEEYMKKLLASSYGVYLTSFFVALYEGFDYVELAGMRVQDIDEKCCEVSVAGEMRRVSPRLMQMLLETSQITTVKSRSRVFRYRYSVYPDSIWKSRKESISESGMIRQFRCLLNEAKGILDEERLNKTIIRNSGYFNRIYFKMIEDGINVKTLELGRNKTGMEQNRKYDTYFEGEVIDNMDMRRFLRSFRSYIDQV